MMKSLRYITYLFVLALALPLAAQEKTPPPAPKPSNLPPAASYRDKGIHQSESSKQELEQSKPPAPAPVPAPAPDDPAKVATWVRSVEEGFHLPAPVEVDPSEGFVTVPFILDDKFLDDNGEIKTSENGKPLLTIVAVRWAVNGWGKDKPKYKETKEGIDIRAPQVYRNEKGVAESEQIFIHACAFFVDYQGRPIASRMAWTLLSAKEGAKLDGEPTKQPPTQPTAGPPTPAPTPDPSNQYPTPMAPNASAIHCLFVLDLANTTGKGIPDEFLALANSERVKALLRSTNPPGDMHKFDVRADYLKKNGFDTLIKSPSNPNGAELPCAIIVQVVRDASGKIVSRALPDKKAHHVNITVGQGGDKNPDYSKIVSANEDVLIDMIGKATRSQPLP